VKSGNTGHSTADEPPGDSLNFGDHPENPRETLCSITGNALVACDWPTPGLSAIRKLTSPVREPFAKHRKRPCEITGVKYRAGLLSHWKIWWLTIF